MLLCISLGLFRSMPIDKDIDMHKHDNAGMMNTYNVMMADGHEVFHVDAYSSEMAKRAAERQTLLIHGVNADAVSAVTVYAYVPITEHNRLVRETR